MIWTPGRNRQQGTAVADLYRRADDVPCERMAVIIGGLHGADKPGALAAAGIDRTRYLTVSVDGILQEMAACRLIPAVEGLSPLEAADLVHAEAQFLAKRLTLRALADGRNLILDITMASEHVVESWLHALRQAGYATTAMFVEIGIEEAMRRSETEHRRAHEDYRAGRGNGGRYLRPEAIRALANTPPSTAERRATGIRSNGSPATPVGSRTPGQAFPASEITSMIASYQAGQLTLEELASQFRARRWPAMPSSCPPGLETAASAIDDPEPYVPGSFDDVVLAYDLGQLSDPEYEALAIAAAAA